MAKFFKARNNGVIALMTEETYEKMNRRMSVVEEAQAKGIAMPLLPPALPIFTFARPGHPSIKHMTGTLGIMSRLLEGHEVIDSSFWVPFSNGIEHGGLALNSEEQEFELGFMTTMDQVVEAFDIAV